MTEATAVVIAEGIITLKISIIKKINKKQIDIIERTIDDLYLEPNELTTNIIYAKNIKCPYNDRIIVTIPEFLKYVKNMIRDKVNNDTVFFWYHGNEMTKPYFDID